MAATRHRAEAGKIERKALSIIDLSAAAEPHLEIKMIMHERKIQMFQFKYTLSEQDFLDFNIYHAFHSPANKRNLLIYRFVIPIAFTFCGVSIGTIVDEPVLSYYFYIAFGIVAILWLIFYKWIMVKQIKKNIGRIKKSGQLPYQRDVTISFGDECFIETTEDGEAKIKYSAIKCVAIAEGAIYIYTNAIQAIPMPFSVFSDETHRNEFLLFVEEKRAEAR